MYISNLAVRPPSIGILRPSLTVHQGQGNQQLPTLGIETEEIYFRGTGNNHLNRQFESLDLLGSSPSGGRNVPMSGGRIAICQMTCEDRFGCS